MGALATGLFVNGILGDRCPAGAPRRGVHTGRRPLASARASPPCTCLATLPAFFLAHFLHCMRQLVTAAAHGGYLRRWGDPLKRPAERVAFDVEAGLVILEGARRYGVVLQALRDGEVTIDEAATTRLRQRMAHEHGPVRLFDRGGLIEELLARCKQKTGIVAPHPPHFPDWIDAVLKAAE